MVRASVRAIIHSLTLVDYLLVQTHNPYSNYRLIIIIIISYRQTIKALGNYSEVNIAVIYSVSRHRTAATAAFIMPLTCTLYGFDAVQSVRGRRRLKECHILR